MPATKQELALRRKKRSDALLRKQGVRLNAHLPIIERGKPRAARAIADRAIALLAVAMRAMNAPADIQKRFARDYKALAKLSPIEKKFMAAKTPDPHLRVQFGWRVEALQVLLWSIGLVDRLGKLNVQVDPRVQLDLILEHKSDAGVAAAARRRSHDDLLDLSDLMYRYHWAVRDAQLHRRPPPAGLQPGIVMERDHAIRWLVQYGTQAWDDISCDT